jgi:hypothetical protein
MRQQEGTKLGKAKKAPLPSSQEKENHNGFWRSIHAWWQIVKLWYFGMQLQTSTSLSNTSATWAHVCNLK